jgi:hypothetical protein
VTEQEEMASLRLPAKKAHALMQLEIVKFVSSFLLCKKGFVMIQDDL